jgi:hypothetical protein
MQDPSTSSGPRVPVTVHTEPSPEEEITNLPGLTGTAAVLVPDHADPIIWQGKANKRLDISALYRGNNAKPRRPPKAAAVSSKKVTLGGSPVPGKPQKKPNIVTNDDDDDEDDDDFDDDDDDEYKALLQRSSNALNRRVGAGIVTGIATKTGEKPVTPVSVVTVAPVVPVAAAVAKAGEFQDACSPAKETGEVLAMKTGTAICRDVMSCASLI